MKQYNRIMLGKGGKYINECLKDGFIGVDFIRNMDMTATFFNDESVWRKQLMKTFLEAFPEKSAGTARNSIGFLWTVCFGLKEGDIVIASDGHGNYHVGTITGGYFFVKNTNLPHRRPVTWSDKVIKKTDMSQKLRNSIGSIGTCCNITKYSAEIEPLIGGATNPIVLPTIPVSEKYKERSLHRLFANYLLAEDIYPKTIFHEVSKDSDSKKWVHPDMVGVRFNDFHDETTTKLIKSADTKNYIELFSYELKRSIDDDHDLKKYFFQALSNSSWANYGYLVAFEISDSVEEEMERLNRAFGIGLIHLSPYPNDTKILFQARKNDLDYYTIDKLCNLNKDFRTFIEKTTKVLTSQAAVQDDVREGLRSFCDRKFASDEEIIAYCTEKNIPL